MVIKIIILMNVLYICCYLLYSCNNYTSQSHPDSIYYFFRNIFKKQVFRLKIRFVFVGDTLKIDYWRHFRDMNVCHKPFYFKYDFCATHNQEFCISRLKGMIFAN